MNSSSVKCVHDFCAEPIDEEFLIINLSQTEDTAVQEFSGLLEMVDGNNGLNPLDIQLMSDCIENQFTSDEVDKVVKIINDSGQELVSSDNVYDPINNPTVDPRLLNSSSVVKTTNARRSRQKSNQNSGKQLRFLFAKYGLRVNQPKKSVEVEEEYVDGIRTRAQLKSKQKSNQHQNHDSDNDNIPVTEQSVGKQLSKTVTKTVKEVNGSENSVLNEECVDDYRTRAQLNKSKQKSNQHQNHGSNNGNISVTEQSVGQQLSKTVTITVKEVNGSKNCVLNKEFIYEFRNYLNKLKRNCLHKREAYQRRNGQQFRQLLPEVIVERLDLNSEKVKSLLNRPLNESLMSENPLKPIKRTDLTVPQFHMCLRSKCNRSCLPKKKKNRRLICRSVEYKPRSKLMSKHLQQIYPNIKRQKSSLRIRTNNTIPLSLRISYSDVYTIE